MELLERYQREVFALLENVQASQEDAIRRAGEAIALALEGKKKVYLGEVVHGIERDLINRGGGPTYYRRYKGDETPLEAGDVLVVSSVSGFSQQVVDLARTSIAKGVVVIALTSMPYALEMAACNPQATGLHQVASIVLDNCAPVAEAMLEVDGLDARFAAASGISSDFILWSITAVTVEKLLADGYEPGILKSLNFPGGKEQYDALWERFETTGL